MLGVIINLGFRPMAISELDKLLAQAGKGKPAQHRTGNAKFYFNANFEKIMHLSKLGMTYKEIIAAISLDGVDMSLAHFKRLMANAKKNGCMINEKLVNSSENAGSNEKPSENERKAAAPKARQSNPLLDKDYLVKEIDKIQKSNISVAEKREAIERLTKPLENLNPLSRNR